MLRRKSAEALCICEKDITSLQQQLQETNKELAQANNNREMLAQEKDRLQEHLSNAKQENQVYMYREILTKKENVFLVVHRIGALIFQTDFVTSCLGHLYEEAQLLLCYGLDVCLQEQLLNSCLWSFCENNCGGYNRYLH